MSDWGSPCKAHDTTITNGMRAPKMERPIEIPFNRPGLAGSELEYMRQAVQNEKLAGDGHFSHMCEELLQGILGVERVLLTTSCTDALEMAALLLETEPGDEVIIPSFAFPSIGNAFVLRGAKPVFVDVRADTLNLNESLIETLVSNRTKAIVVLHYGGVGCEMTQIMAIAKEHHLHVVEDSAHGLFGKYKGRYLGTFGTFGTQSFHETKNFTCGEGGAILINDPAFVTRAEILREKGTNRSQFFRGLVDKYTWVDHGSSFLMSDLLAAFLYGQLEKREQIQGRRERIWTVYMDELRVWAQKHGVTLPTIPASCEQTHHLFFMLMPDASMRQRLMAKLRSKGILAVFHYLPLHLSKMGRKFGGEIGQCPVAEDVSDRLLRLPFYTSMTEDEQATVVREVLKF